jgi:hypothetical protein
MKAKPSFRASFWNKVSLLTMSVSGFLWSGCEEGKAVVAPVDEDDKDISSSSEAPLPNSSHEMSSSAEPMPLYGIQPEYGVYYSSSSNEVILPDTAANSSDVVSSSVLASSENTSSEVSSSVESSSSSSQIPVSSHDTPVALYGVFMPVDEEPTKLPKD